MIPLKIMAYKGYVPIDRSTCFYLAFVFLLWINYREGSVILCFEVGINNCIKN